MALAKTCYTCEYYIPTRSSQVGICDRVGDQPCFSVSPNLTKCLYETSGNALTQESIVKRDSEQVEKIRQFDISLDRASKMVAS